MFDFIYQLIRTARPRRWLKNLAVIAAPLFAGYLFDPDIYVPTFQAFIAFCVVSSGCYFINDIIDVNADRLHPVKKNRPIASGKLSETVAWIVAFALILGAVAFSILHIGTYFTFMIVLYLILQIVYSLYFRNIIILDSLLVAAGFVLRVFSGGFVTNTSISSWLALATIGLSLLLAFGKSRSEKTILAKHLKSTGEISTRETLKHYPDNLLDSMISTSASFCVITYSLFAFQASPTGLSPALQPLLPSILSSPKWMMLTIPLVIYGVARYLYVIYEKEEGESPERVLLSDRPLLLAVIVWAILVLTITYIIPSVR